VHMPARACVCPHMYGCIRFKLVEASLHGLYAFYVNAFVCTLCTSCMCTFPYFGVSPNLMEYLYTGHRELHVLLDFYTPVVRRDVLWNDFRLSVNCLSGLQLDNLGTSNRMGRHLMGPIDLKVTRSKVKVTGGCVVKTLSGILTRQPFTKETSNCTGRHLMGQGCSLLI
jgi:hypothetical protein